MLKNIFLAAVVAVFSAAASAQHAHSDIDALVEDGQIVLETGILLTDGSLLFEADFGDLGQGLNGTDDPGFVLDDGSFNAGEILAFEVTSPLQFWNGSSWLNSTTGSETISIFDSLGVTTSVTANSIMNPLGIIDQADSEGGVHTHVDFEINETADFGSYLLELALKGFSDTSLSNELYTASDSFFIAFNYGLDEEGFEASIDALGVAAVPVPAAWVFLMSGFGTLVVGRRALGKR